MHCAVQVSAMMSDGVDEAEEEGEGLTCFDRLVRARRETQAELPTLRSDGSIQEPGLEHLPPMDDALSPITPPQAGALDMVISVDFAAPEPHTVMDSRMFSAVRLPIAKPHPS
jgi:hypothetical protein